jgi:uncharacterized membrane protein/nitrite reductase/ring-hydroxylating ferredoxin subunit
MAEHRTSVASSQNPTREQLVSLLNEDLAREYQAIIAYVVYSQVLKGAEYMQIAGELEKHAKQELDHALTIAKQIDYLGGMPTVTARPVKTSEKAEEMLQFDMDNENETVRNYRARGGARRSASTPWRSRSPASSSKSRSIRSISRPPWARTCPTSPLPRNGPKFRDGRRSQMRSTANFKSHPIHPMLVAFPIAFLCGALAFDAAGRLLGWPGGWTTGAYLSLAAIAAGLVAAVPGLVDYLYTVPPNSSSRARATQHLLINISALSVFALGWAFRDGATLAPGTGTLLLEAAGVGLITLGGWLGGTLVFRNQIGVDHRYARAGKWKEQAFERIPGGPIAVAKEGELEVDQMKLLLIGDRRIVLARTEQDHVAFDDRCSHKGGPLSDGVLICGTVQCPWHGSQFNAHSGTAKAGPAIEPIGTYRVELANGDVRLSLPR